MASGKAYLTLDDLDLDGKTVLLRLDINSPIADGRVMGKDRIAASAESVDALASRGARVIILAHQGRQGSDDYTSLAEHARILDDATTATITFQPSVHDAPALAAISGVMPGAALMLENVRGLDDENAKGTPEALANTAFVKDLAKIADYFVNDAFSAAHRAQTSLVGFAEVLPSAAGVAMDRELTALANAVSAPADPSVYFLGGAKPEDSIAVMQHNFSRGVLDTALLGGLVGELFLVARGHKLGKPTMELLERKGILKLLPEAEALLAEYDYAILTPVDVAMKNGHNEYETAWIENLPINHPILDIGPETMAAYRKEILEAGSLMMNGPAGLYEEPPFDKGTRAILEAFRESKAFSLLGGGHTTTALHAFGHEFSDFGYVSLAGGALMSFITGKKLPAVDALERAAARY